MRWRQWSNKHQIKTQMLDVRTPERCTLRRSGCGNDPWITEWEQEYDWEALLTEPFILFIVGEMWALGDLKNLVSQG